MKRVLLIVPDGVAVRNYLYSSFVSELQNNNAEVILYHQISNAAIDEVKKVNPAIEIKKTPSFIEKPLARLLRESITYARLLSNKRVLDNPTIMSFWNRDQNSIKQKMLYRFAELIGTVFSCNYKLILKMEALYDKKIYKDPILNTIYEDLDLLKPDYILNLHQRAPISAPIILAAKNKNISTASVIFSWDNVPKARLISRYDTYFTWSEIMKEELGLLYPEISSSQIKVVGSPQFEFYLKDEFLMTKEVFFSEFNLDVNKKTICFSANDMSSPYEANYLEDICEEILKIEEASRPQILFRRCPVDKSTRFDVVLEKYKNLLFPIDPDWRIEKGVKESSFVSIYPSFNDISLLVNTVKYSDVVINFGSTMAHDFAVYDKPCLYLNYEPVENSVFKAEIAYQFQHFRTMEGLDAVGWLNAPNEISNKILEALKNPDSLGKDRKKWLEKIVQHPLNSSSKQISEIILK